MCTHPALPSRRSPFKARDIGANRNLNLIAFPTNYPPHRDLPNAPLVCSQPSLQQFFDAYQSQGPVLLEEAFVRELADKTEGTHHRDSRGLSQLGSIFVTSPWRGEHGFRDVR